MSVEPEQVVEVVEGEVDFSQLLPRQTQEDVLGTDPPPSSDDTGEGPEALEDKVSFLQLQLEEVQGESSLMKEWGARIEMYVDCLVDALETNNITHVYDVDGSLVSLDECRQKAKTLPYTTKPHCDEDVRTQQYETEIDNLRQETEALTTDLEDALQRSAEQEYLIDGLRTAEYQANCRWETYHENAMQQWSKCYSDLQGQYKDTVARSQSLNTAFENLKRTTAGRNVGGGFNRPDPFRRYRSAGPMYREVSRQAVPGLYHQQRQPVAASGERMRSMYQSRGYRDRNDFTPVLPRAERAAILKQFFTNLNMIHHRQQEYAAAGRRNRPRYEQRRRPGPYGEAN